MKKISKYIVSALLALCVFGIIPTANASTALFPKPIEDYLKEGIINSYLVTTSNGYMRVYYDENSNKVGIEYYDSNFNITSTKSIAMELNEWGGFYKGSDAYYLIEGQDNENEEYDAEYMRVIKYDFNWNKTGTAKVTTALPDKNSAFIVGEPPSNETSGIFYISTVSVEEYNNTLYIATGHRSYRDSKGSRHQGLLLVAVDESTMECHIVDENFYHSNDHYLVNDSADIYMIDSRSDKYLYLSLYDSNMYSGDTYSDRSDRTKSKGSILDYKFGYAYNTPSGIELSDNNVLTLFESADFEAPDIEYAYHYISNIYLAVTPKSNMTKEATTIKKLADYSAVYSTSRNLPEAASMHITKINNNRFLITWGDREGILRPTDSSDTLSGYTLHYIFVDGNGNSLTQEYTVNARVSECPPVLNGSKVVFSSSSDDAINFYTIDANSGDFNKKVYNKSANNDTPSSSSTTTSSSTSSVKPQSSSTVSSSSSSVKPQSSSSSKSSSKSSSSSIKSQSSSSSSSSIPASSSSSSVTESLSTTSSSSSGNTSTSSSSVSSSSSSVSTSSSSSSTSSVPAESVSSSNSSSSNNSSSSSINSTDNDEDTSDNGFWIIIAIVGGAVVVAGVIIAVAVAKIKK